MKKRFGKLLASLFAGIVTVTAVDYTAFAASTSNPPLFYYISPNSKITKQDNPDYSEMSYMNSLRFKAAANERESAQMILTGTGTYKDFKMQLDGDLETKDGLTIPKSNFEIYYEQYVDEVASWEITDSGRYPDALIPSALAVDTSIPASKRPTNFTINSKKKNQGFWFTVNVPQGQEPGIYTANLQFSYKLDGTASTYEIPVHLTVFDFELSDKTESASRLAVHASSSCKDTILSSTGITDTNGQAANLVYLEKLNAFMDQRKVSSGNSGVVYTDVNTNNLTEYVNGIYNFVKNNKAPYYDITMDYRHSEQPIKLESNTDFLTVLDSGLSTFKGYNISIPLKVNNQKVETLEDLKKLNWASQEVKDQLIDHIDSVAVNLNPPLKAQAEAYLGSNKEILAKKKNKQPSENDNLTEILKHFYAKYLLKYTEKKSENKPDPTLGEARSLLSGVLRLCGEGKSSIAAPYYHYLYTPLCVISQYDWYASSTKRNIGVERIMRTIVDKSMTEKTDLLQYAFLRIPCVDEPPRWLISSNLETLVNAYILEQCKANLQTYINGKSAKTVLEKQTKASLLKSLENLMFLFTTTPTAQETGYVDTFNKTLPVYTAIQYKGLKFLKTTSDWTSLKKLLSARFKYDSTAGKYLYTETFSGQYLTDSATTKSTSTIRIPDDFFNKDYCPLFNEFTSNSKASPQDAAATAEGLSRQDVRMWWYSCVVSNRYAGLSGFRLNQNRTKNGIFMNPIAVKRANKWQQYQLGIRGELYWAVDAGFKNLDTLGLKGNEDLLVYPVKQLLKNAYGISDETKLNNLAKKHGYFCSTIRLENEAEAADDYDYLCLAEDLVEQHPEYRDELNRIISSVINPGDVDYTDPNKTNSANLTQARLDLAALIEKLTENIHKDSDGFSIPSVSKWKASYKGISFDFKPTTSINSASQIAASIYLYQNNLCLTKAKRLRLDGSTTNVVGTITKLENGWYNYTVPFSAFPVNQSGYGSKTANRVQFGSMNHRFLIKDFKIVKEVSDTTANNSNTFTSSADNVPVIKNWHSSGKTLCFDVFETTTYQNSNGKRKATVSLMNSDWKLLNNLFQIDFANKKLVNCPGAVIDKGNGWLTVQIPLNTVPLYNGSSGAAATGTETLSMVHFKKDYVYCSFLVDNFKIVKEVTDTYTTGNSSNTFTDTADGVPVVTNWNSSGKTLCFDVYETSTYQNSNGKRRATVSLMNSDWKLLNSLFYIDFANKKLVNCPGTVIDKGNGWITVQIPLNTVPLYNGSSGAAATGTETLSMVHFKKDYVYRSFLVDNFRLI